MGSSCLHLAVLILLTACHLSFSKGSGHVEPREIHRILLREAAEAPEDSQTRRTPVDEDAVTGGANQGPNNGADGDPSSASLDPLASSTHCNVTGQCIPCTSDQMKTEASCRATGYHQEISCLESFSPHQSTSLPGRTRLAPSMSSADVTTSSNDTGNILEGLAMRDEVRGQHTEGGRNSSRAAEDAVKEAPVSDAGGAGNAPSRAGARSKLLRNRSLRVLDRPAEAAALAVRRSFRESGGGAKGETEKRAEMESQGDAVHHHRGDRVHVTFESCSPMEEETLSVWGFEAIMLSLLLVCAPVVYQRKRKATSSVAMVRLPTSRLS